MNKLSSLTYSFRWKSTFAYFFVIVLSFGLAAYFLDTRLEENALRQIKSSLLSQAYLIQQQIPSDPVSWARGQGAAWDLKVLSRKAGVRLTMVNRQGGVIAESEKSPGETALMENHKDRPEIKEALEGKVGESIRYSATLRINMLYLALPLVFENQTVGAVRVALPLEYVKKTLLTTRNAIFASFLFSLGLAFFLSAVLARSIIGPMNKIIRSAKHFAKGDFSHKIFLDSNDELGTLAAALNTMAADIEEKLKEIEVQNQQLKAVFASMVEGIIVVDRGARIVSINSPIERIFGITLQDSREKTFLEAIRNNEIADIISKAMESAGVVSQELSLLWPVRKIFQINASPVFERGQVNGCLVVIHDITEIRKLETMRSDFVANVSHELKTPLTSIKGFVETLLEGALEDKEHNRQFLEIIHEHAKRLDNLINDLLDLSYLESKELRLKKENVALKPLVEKILSGSKAQVNKKGIIVENRLPDALTAQADRTQLEQVFTNLIDNAIKFNREKGSLKIYSDSRENTLRIVIEDSGIGIPPKDTPRIFERFYRVDKARSRELGGTGLGLSIVKHIVELHGGSVGVESTEGLGSKFWFTLPL